MNIVDSILAQSGAGSANGQGFGDWFARGQQMAMQRRQLDQSQQRIDIERLQQQAQQTLLPAQQALLQQKVQMGRLQIDQTLRDRQDEIDTQAAFGELMGKTGDLLQDGQPAAALAEVLRAGGQNPALAKQPRYVNLLRDIQVSANLTSKADMLDATNRRIDILQQNADTAAQKVQDTKEFKDAMLPHIVAAKDAQAAAANARAAIDKNKLQNILFTANHMEENASLAAMKLEMKKVADNPADSYATTHRKLQAIFDTYKREHPNAFTPQARNHFEQVLQLNAPDSQPAPAAAAPAAQPAATHRFDPDTGDIVPVAPSER